MSGLHHPSPINNKPERWTSSRAWAAALSGVARTVPWYGWAITYFVTITLAVTWPLVLRMGSSVVGSRGDSLLFIWLIGWVERSLFSLHQSPLFTDLINYPVGWMPASTELAPAMVLTAVPFSVIGGPVLGYNLSVLTSFAISGCVVCWWVYRKTRMLLPGLIAGTLFAFSSYRVAHFMAGHLNLLGTQWLALYFLAFYEAQESASRGRAWVILAGTSLGMVSWTSQYYLYMTFLLTAVAVPLHAILRGPRFVLRKAYLLRLAGILAVSTPLILAAVAPHIEAREAGSLPTRAVEEAIRNSAALADYVLPTTWNDLAGDWVAAHFDRSLWIEASLYLGISAVALAGLAAVIHGEEIGSRATRGHMAILALTALVLSLGPRFHCFSGEAPPRLPPALGWIPKMCETSVPLPGQFLSQLLPFYTSVRVPARYGVYVILFVCVLAGLGIAYLQKRLPRSRRAVAVALIIAIVAFDLEPWRARFSTVEGREVDYWLATQPGEGAVVELPIGGQDTRLYAYYGLIHGKPIFGGQNIYPYALDGEINAALSEFPVQQDIDLLRSAGAEYLIVDSRLYDQIYALDDIEEALASLGVQRAKILGDYQVYELTP